MESIQWDCWLVSWGNIQDIQPDFADANDDDVLGNLPCDEDQIAKYDGANWICTDDFLGNLECTEDQIVAKWNGTHWNCAAESGSSQSIEFLIEIPLTDVPAIQVIEEFEITGLPLSTAEYSLPINFMKIEADLSVDFGDFAIILEATSGNSVDELLRITTDESALSYRAANHLQNHVEELTIPIGTTEVSFELIGEPFKFGAAPTGTFDNLKFIINFPLPDDAMIGLTP